MMAVVTILKGMGVLAGIGVVLAAMTTDTGIVLAGSGAILLLCWVLGKLVST